jgi:hypothetical protein
VQRQGNGFLARYRHVPCPAGKACQPIGGLADLPDAARRLVEGFLGAFAKGQMGLKQTIEDQIEVTSGV